MKFETIITAAFGGAAGILGGILGYIKFFAERKDKKETDRLEKVLDKKLAPLIEKQEAIEKRLDKIEAHDTRQDEELRQIRMDTLRTQMYLKMSQESHNHDTIFKIAEVYFISYHGDWVATVDFQAWADKEKVKIPEPILRAIAENEARK